MSAKLSPLILVILISAILIATVRVTGCVPLATAPHPSLDTNAIYTQAAETLAFQLTLKAGQDAVAALTEISQVTPSPLPGKPSYTPTRRPTPTPQASTDTPAPPADTPLAGKSVEFILTVLNNGDSQDDWVFWLRPSILR